MTEACVTTIPWSNVVAILGVCALFGFLFFCMFRAWREEPAAALAAPPVWKYTRTKTIRQPVTKESQTKRGKR